MSFRNIKDILSIDVEKNNPNVKKKSSDVIHWLAKTMAFHAGHQNS